MRALKIEAEGLTTSFRYAHFLVGRQPTFRMPPPATIYGHICSTVGEFLDPSKLRIAYVFTHGGVGDDVELLHILVVSTGTLEGTRVRRNLQGTMQPTRREILLFPRLTLYIDAPDELERLYRAFREPRYVVVLGRSQDLMSYRRVELVELEERPRAYFESTLLPWSYRSRLQAGVGVTMPRFIDPVDRRRVVWSPFVVLEERVYLAPEGMVPARRAVVPMGPGERVWVDPATETHLSCQRAVVWLSLDGVEADGINFLASPQTPLG